jgi:hypothetical protein
MSKNKPDHSGVGRKKAIHQQVSEGNSRNRLTESPCQEPTATQMRSVDSAAEATDTHFESCCILNKNKQKQNSPRPSNSMSYSLLHHQGPI